MKEDRGAYIILIVMLIFVVCLVVKYGFEQHDNQTSEHVVIADVIYQESSYTLYRTVVVEYYGKNYVLKPVYHGSLDSTKTKMKVILYKNKFDEVVKAEFIEYQ